jgi:hypothetical protein
LPALFIAWSYGAFRNWKNTLALIGGGAIALVILIAAYMAANQHVNIGGTLTEENQAASYLKNLPIMHPFSWSAQTHQLGAKAYYLWHEAPAFAIALPVIVLSTNTPHC